MPEGKNAKHEIFVLGPIIQHNKENNDNRPVIKVVGADGEVECNEVRGSGWKTVYDRSAGKLWLETTGEVVCHD